MKHPATVKYILAQLFFNYIWSEVGKKSGSHSLTIYECTTKKKKNGLTLMNLQTLSFVGFYKWCLCYVPSTSFSFIYQFKLLYYLALMTLLFKMCKKKKKNSYSSFSFTIFCYPLFLVYNLKKKINFCLHITSERLLLSTHNFTEISYNYSCSLYT